MVETGCGKNKIYVEADINSVVRIITFYKLAIPILLTELRLKFVKKH